MKAIILCVLVSTIPGGVANAQSFEPWLNNRINDVVAARIEVSDPAKRAVAPAASGPDSPLVDRGAVPDVVGISVRLPSQVADDEVLPTTAAFSGNPIALIVGLLESGTLDPSFYLANPGLRRFGANVAFDADAEGRPRTIFQARYLIRDRGNVLANDTRVSSALAASADAYGRLSRQVLDILWQRVGRARFPDAVSGRVDFLNTLTDSLVMAGTLSAAGDAGIAEIDAAIRREVEDFVALRSVIDDAAAAARRRPLLAIGVSGELTDAAARQVRVGGIWDVSRGAADLTLNAGWNYVEATADLPEVSRAEIAGQLTLRLSQPNPLSGSGPFSLAIAGSAGLDVKNDASLTYKVQGILSLPLASGVNVPLSATWASSRDQINEKELRGNVGFSFDLAQLMLAIR